MQGANIESQQLKLTRSTSLDTGLDQIYSQAFGKNVRCNSSSTSLPATDQSPLSSNPDKSIYNFNIKPATPKEKTDTTQEENRYDFEDAHISALFEPESIITISEAHKEALEQIKSACDDVITNKNRDISSRKIPVGITKFVAITSALVAVAIILFITLAEPAMLVLAASIMVFSISTTAFVISSLYSIAVRLDTTKDNTHSFIANMLKDMGLKNLEKQPETLVILYHIINNYLNGSIPINLEPFAKLTSLSRTDIDAETKNKTAQEQSRKILENFIEILQESVVAGHKEAKNITPDFLDALKADITAYTETLTANKVIALANLPLNKPKVEKNPQQIEPEEQLMGLAEQQIASAEHAKNSMALNAAENSMGIEAKENLDTSNT